MVNPQFNWEDYQGPESQMIQEDIAQQQEVVEEIPEPKESFQWGNFDSPETYQGEPDPTADESTLGYLARNLISGQSRLLEQAFGKYGNLEKVGKSILSDLPQTGGLLGMAISELVGPEKWQEFVKGKPGREQILPTSEQLKELSQVATAGYTKPKTKGEESFQGVVEDIGSTLSPTQAFTPRNVLLNNLGIPLASNAVEKTVESLGFGKDKGTIAKLATWTSLSLAGNVNAPQYASNLMNQGRNGIPNTANFNIRSLQTRLQNVANDPHLLHADPRTALARQQLAAIQNDLANGQTSLRSLMTSYDGVNAAKRSRGLFELNRNDQNFARRAIDRVRDAVGDEIRSYANQYPEAINNWQNGIQAWATIHQSRAMSNYVEGLAKGPYAKMLSGPAAGLFGISSLGAYKAPLLAGPLSIATPAAYKSGQVLYRVWGDENLARYYWNAIGAAAEQNTPAFIKNYNALNKGLEKSDTTKKKAKPKEK